MCMYAFMHACTFLEKFLAAVAAAGRRYGMELHYGKLQLLNVQCSRCVKMPNCELLHASRDMEYLGTVLHEDGRTGSALGRRIGMAKRELNDLARVWRQSNLPRGRKLQIYRSLVESKLLYGLACCCLSAAELRRLNGFQARCLRQVLGIKAAYYSRVSNKTVLERAGRLSASELLIRQQLTILGRVLRSPSDSSLQQAAFIPNTLTPVTSFYVRRQGRPRKEWATTVLREAHARNTTGLNLMALSQMPQTWRQIMTR